MLLFASLIPVANHNSGNLIWQQLGCGHGLSDLTFFWRVLWGALESDGVGATALSSLSWIFLLIFRFTWFHFLLVWGGWGWIHTRDILLLKTILFCRIRSVLSSFIFCSFTGIFWFFCVFKRCCVLLESRLRSFLQKSVDTLIEIIRGHVVIDNAEPCDVDSSIIGASIRVAGHFCKLTLLLDHFNRFPIRSTLRHFDTLLFATSLIDAFGTSLLFLNWVLLIKNKILIWAG